MYLSSYSGEGQVETLILLRNCSVMEVLLIIGLIVVGKYEQKIFFALRQIMLSKNLTGFVPL